jgi:hydroxymethylpyrimidine/phosphomethylpyrimidine kinase
MQRNAPTPVIMTLSSHDPSGCVGIQADIETSISLGCHCTPIVTALCARDTRDIKDVTAVDTGFLIEQSRAILEDMPVKAIKLDYLANVSQVEAVHTILRDYPGIPVVLNPARSIANLASREGNAVLEAAKHLLFPATTLLCPDIVEAHQIAQQGDTIDACAQEILEAGGDHLLISGTRRCQKSYENSLYNSQGLVRRYTWERLSVFSHGGGATLSASIACYLGHGLLLRDAVQQGQNFAWHSLAASRRLGMGYGVPNRLFWADKNVEGGRTRGSGGGC